MPDALLIKYSVGDIDIFAARNMLVSHAVSDRPTFMMKKILLYLKDSKYKRLIKSNAVKNDMSGIGVLYAHGGYARAGLFKDKWVFDDSNRLHEVQTWIDKYDDRYNLLMLFCYANEDVTIHSEKSVILLPDDSYIKRDIPELVQSRLYVPSLGLIDITNVNHKVINKRNDVKNDISNIVEDAV